MAGPEVAVACGAVLLAAAWPILRGVRRRWRRWLAVTLLLPPAYALLEPALLSGHPLFAAAALLLLTVLAAWSAAELFSAAASGSDPREMVAPFVFPVAVLGVKRGWWSTGYAAQMCGLNYVEFVETCRKLGVKLWRAEVEDLDYA